MSATRSSRKGFIWAAHSRYLLRRLTPAPDHLIALGKNNRESTLA